MKNEKILTILLLVSLTWSLQPANAAVGDTIVWDLSLTTGIDIVWRMTDYHYISDAFSIGGNVLDVGDTIRYSIVNTPQTVADDVYDSNGPEFVEMYIYDDLYIPWTDVTESLVNVLLSRIIIPMEYHLANGTVLDLEQTIKYIASFDGAIYSVTVNLDGDYYTTYYDTSYGEIYVDYNINTGIAKSFYTISPSGDATFEIDVFESSIDDAGTTITNTLTWYSGLTLGTHIAWRLVDLVNEDGYVSMGQDEYGNEYGIVWPGDTIIFSFLDSPPTEPLEVYGDAGDPSTFLELYAGGEYVSWDQVDDTPGTILSWVINPLQLALYNTTTYNMTEFMALRGSLDGDIEVMSITIDGDYAVVWISYATWEWDEGLGMDILDNFTVTYTVNLVTGISNQIEYYDPDTGDFALFVLDIFQSTIDDGGIPISNELSWYNRLVSGISIAWQLVEFTGTEDIVWAEDEYGNEFGHMSVGDDLKFVLTDDLPTNPLAVYGDEAEPSTFLEVYASHDFIPFEYLDQMGGTVLSWLINPISLDLYNGTTFDLATLLSFRAEMDGNVVDYSITPNGDYLDLWLDYSYWRWDEGAQEGYMENITMAYLINANTGITREFTVMNPDTGEYGIFVLDIWESGIDDYGVTINNELTWYSGITPVTWLSWEITELNTEDPEMNFELAGYNLTVHDYLRFKFYNTIPTDPVDVYGDHGPDFVNLYINNDMASWEDIEGIAEVILRLSVMPLQLELYNGTTFDLIAFVQLLDAMMDELTITSMSQTSDSVTFAIHMEFTHWEDDGEYTETADVTYTIILATGISSEIFISVPSGNPAYGPSTMRLVFSVPYSSIDQYGNDNSDFTESVPSGTETTTPGENTVSIPGFTTIITAIGVISAVILKKRK